MGGNEQGKGKAGAIQVATPLRLLRGGRRAALPSKVSVRPPRCIRSVGICLPAERGTPTWDSRTQHETADARRGSEKTPIGWPASFEVRSGVRQNKKARSGTGLRERRSGVTAHGAMITGQPARAPSIPMAGRKAHDPPQVLLGLGGVCAKSLAVPTHPLPVFRPAQKWGACSAPAC